MNCKLKEIIALKSVCWTFCGNGWIFHALRYFSGASIFVPSGVPSCLQPGCRLSFLRFRLLFGMQTWRPLVSRHDREHRSTGSSCYERKLKKKMQRNREVWVWKQRDEGFDSPGPARTSSVLWMPLLMQPKAGQGVGGRKSWRFWWSLPIFLAIKVLWPHNSCSFRSKTLIKK